MMSLLANVFGLRYSFSIPRDMTYRFEIKIESDYLNFYKIFQSWLKKPSVQGR